MVEILVTEPEYFDEESMEILRSVGSVTAKRMSKEKLLKIAGKFDAFVVRIETKIDRGVLDAAKKLKVIGSATTGLNHIDVEYAKEKGVKVINLSSAHTTSTAEYTFSLMMALSRKIPWAFDNLRKGKWERHKFFGNVLNGKTLGIIGYGKIGKTVAGYAKAFGMDVVAFDPHIKTEEVKLVSLQDLLKASDIITVHAALTEQTKNMIGKEQFKLMKKTAMLINTARGQIVNKEDLVDALKNNIIKGAAQDVFDEEPLNPKDPIIKYSKENKNLIITPHIAATTVEASHEAGLEIAKAVVKTLHPETL